MPSLDEAVRAFAAADRADNTRRAYAADWRDFSTWCSLQGEEQLPASPSTLAKYLAAKAGELRVSTLARRLAAVRSVHRAHDLAAPDSADLRRTWSGIKRRLGRPPRKKKPLLTEQLLRLVAQTESSPRGARDRAVLLVGLASALRRSELAALELDGPNAGPVQLVFVEEGVEIHLERSKGDQEGRGRIVPIPWGSTDLCPVSALMDWIAQSLISTGAVFRPIDRWGQVGASAITPKTVATIVKTYCKAAGLDPRLFAGHSLRSGHITQAIMAGVPADVVQRQSGHKRLETMLGYVQIADRFKHTSARGLGL